MKKTKRNFSFVWSASELFGKRRRISIKEVGRSNSKGKKRVKEV